MAEAVPTPFLRSAESLLVEALGRAISRWATAEFSIVQIFSIATGMPLPMAAAILRNVKTFSLLLDMCHSAVRLRLSGRPEAAYWDSLVEYTRELSGDRNYMAHTILMYQGPVPPNSPDGHLSPPQIGPSILDVLAGDYAKRMPLGTAELTELLADIQQLVELLIDFEKALTRGETSLEKYRAPISRRRPPRKQRLEAARQAASTQPKSSPG